MNAQLKEIKLRGTLSDAAENTGKEIDPTMPMKMTVQSMVLAGQAAANIAISVNEAAAQGLQVLPHGIAIAQKAIGRLIANQYQFSLLSSNKYMVNDCLGIKVSTGQFGIKFQDPSVTFTQTGDLRIKLKVDRITMSGFKLRMRPRVPDFSDPNPCHFSGKFEVGGSAKDISVTIVLSPKLLSYPVQSATATWCLMGYNNEPMLDWAMDALDLAGLANTYYHNAKEMMFDALDFGLNKLLLNEFLNILREQIKTYYADCQQAVAHTNELVTFSSGNTQTTATSPEKIGNPIKEDSAWNIKSNNLKSNSGRLIFNSPEGSIWVLYIYRMSDDKYVTSYANVNNKGVVSLPPGEYKITINDAPVLNVPIKSGHDTKLKTGVLDVDFEDVWYLYSEDKSDSHTSGNKPMKILLPVGRYLLEESGLGRVVVVKEESPPKGTK